MADKDSATPRVYLLRHGQTAWSQKGLFTGTSDLPLLPIGEQKVRETASHVFGPGLLIDPGNLARVYVSPRQRAQRTLELLFETAGHEAALPASTEGDDAGSGTVDVRVTEDIAEWGYGDYEGLLTKEIRQLRKERGHDTENEWDIWRDGAEGEGSESAENVRERVDGIISEIVELQGKYLADAKKGTLAKDQRRDVLVVAHGHILRAFVKRWLGLDMSFHIELMLEPGGLAGLSYAHSNIDERAVLVGMGFPKI